MTLTRRKFLTGLAAAGAATTLPLGAVMHAFAMPAASQNRVLVLVHLAGGADGHALAVPHSRVDYRNARPTLAQNSVLALPDAPAYGFHPALAPLHTLYRAGQVAVLPGATLPGAGIAHRSAIKAWYAPWQTWLTCTPAGGSQLSAARDLRRYMETAPGLPAQESPFAQQLTAIVAQLQAGTLSQRVVALRLDGFDAHSHTSAARYPTLLADLAESLAAFQHALVAANLHEQVVTLVFSEFGRSYTENRQGGTDHDPAQTLLLLGAVRGGVYPGADARDVFATLSEHWLGAQPGTGHAKLKLLSQ